MSIPKALKAKLELPVSLNQKGEMVSLGDFVRNRSNAYLSLSSLTLQQRAKITAERFRHKSEVNLAVIGAGIINKERAIAEIEAMTPIGQELIEADQYFIDALIGELEHGRFKDALN